MDSGTHGELSRKVQRWNLCFRKITSIWRVGEWREETGELVKSLQGLGEAWLREKCNDSGHEHGKKVIYFKCI